MSLTNLCFDLLVSTLSHYLKCSGSFARQNLPGGSRPLWWVFDECPAPVSGPTVAWPFMWTASSLHFNCHCLKRIADGDSLKLFWKANVKISLLKLCCLGILVTMTQKKCISLYMGPLGGCCKGTDDRFPLRRITALLLGFHHWILGCEYVRVSSSWSL